MKTLNEMSFEELARMILEGKAPPKDDKKDKKKDKDGDKEALASELLDKIKKDLGVSGSGDDPDGDDKENDPVADSSDENDPVADSSDENDNGKPDGTEATEPHEKPDGSEHVGSDDEVNDISDDEAGKPAVAEPFKKEPKKPDMSKAADKDSENPVDKAKKKESKKAAPEEKSAKDDGGDASPSEADDEKDPDSKENKQFSDDKGEDGDDPKEKGKSEDGDDSEDGDAEDDEHPIDKEDKTTEEDGEGGTVKGDEADNEGDVDLIDGSSKSKINLHPEIKDEHDEDNSEPSEDEESQDDDSDNPDSAKDPEAGSKKAKPDGEGEEKDPDSEDEDDNEPSDKKKPDPKADKKKKKKPGKSDGEALKEGAEIVSPKFGVGQSIPGQFYLHYDGDYRVDVMFDHGIERVVVEQTRTLSGLRQKIAHHDHEAEVHADIADKSLRVGNGKFGKHYHRMSRHQQAIDAAHNMVVKKKYVNEGAKPALEFDSTAHHSKMYRHHDQQGRVIQRRIDDAKKRRNNGEVGVLEKRLNYHRGRCTHHENQLSSDK